MFKIKFFKVSERVLMLKGFDLKVRNFNDFSLYTVMIMFEMEEQGS